MISRVLDSGLQGLSKSLQGAERAASNIASAGQHVPDTAVGEDLRAIATKDSGSNSFQADLIHAVVDLKVYEQSFKASAKVIDVASDTLGTLLDTDA
jgi:hypothetical protein